MLFVEQSFVRIEGLSLRHCGQGTRLARYPLHWHKRGDGKGQYLKRSAVYDSFIRGVTVHSTNQLYIADNVVFNVYGHS
jgi:hypothetical protein